MSKFEPIHGRGGRATIKAKTASKPARFQATIYSGIELSIAGYDLPIVVDLAGLTPGNLLVANLDHDPSQRVGSGFTVNNTGRQLTATGEINAHTPAAHEVLRSAKKGYRWQTSIEVAPQQIETLKPGKATTVNGRSFTGPKYITRKGVLKGFAFVSHGADDNTSATIGAGVRSLAARVAQLPDHDLRRAIAGSCTLLVLEQLTGIDGDIVREALEAGNVEPEFTHANVHHYPIIESVFAVDSYTTTTQN